MIKKLSLNKNYFQDFNKASIFSDYYRGDKEILIVLKDLKQVYRIIMNLIEIESPFTIKLIILIESVPGPRPLR